MDGKHKMDVANDFGFFGKAHLPWEQEIGSADGLQVEDRMN